MIYKLLICSSVMGERKRMGRAGHKMCGIKYQMRIFAVAAAEGAWWQEEGAHITSILSNTHEVSMIIQEEESCRANPAHLPLHRAKPALEPKYGISGLVRLRNVFYC